MILETLSAGTYYFEVSANDETDYDVEASTATGGEDAASVANVTSHIRKRPFIGELTSFDEAVCFKFTVPPEQTLGTHSVSDLSLKGEAFGTGEDAISSDGSSDGEDFMISRELETATYTLKVTSPDSDSVA